MTIHLSSSGCPSLVSAVSRERDDSSSGRSDRWSVEVRLGSTGFFGDWIVVRGRWGSWGLRYHLWLLAIVGRARWWGRKDRSCH